MDEQTQPTPAPAPHGRVPPPRLDLNAELGSMVLGLLVGGGVCLYLGLAFMADAPAKVSPEQAESLWFVVDNVLFWCLRVVGLLLLLAAALAFARKRIAALVAAVGELGFTLVMIAMAIENTIEARVDGYWDYFVILYAVLAIVAASAAKRSWQVYRLSSRPGPASE